MGDGHPSSDGSPLHDLSRPSARNLAQQCDEEGNNKNIKIYYTKPSSFKHFNRKG
jgi:hypothetical protein